MCAELNIPGCGFPSKVLDFPPVPHRCRVPEAATRPVKRYQLLDEEDALGVLQAASPGVRVRSSGGGRKKACLLITCLLLLTGNGILLTRAPAMLAGMGYTATCI